MDRDVLTFVVLVFIRLWWTIFVSITSTVVGDDWCISILVWAVLDWRISILVVQTRDCCLSGPQWHSVGIALFDPTIPVDVVRVKSSVDSVPTCVPMCQ